MCSNLAVMSCVTWRRPSAVATIASACGTAAFTSSCLVAK